MDLLKQFLDTRVTVLISNKHYGVPTAGAIQEVIGVLKAYDDTHAMFEVQVDDGAIQIINWHSVVTVIANEELAA